MFFLLLTNHYININYFNSFLQIFSKPGNYLSSKKNYFLEKNFTKINFFNKIFKQKSIIYSLPKKIEKRNFLDDILGIIYIKYQWVEYFFEIEFDYLNFNDSINVFKKKIFLKLNFFKKKFFLKKIFNNLSEINLTIFDQYNDMKNFKPKLFIFFKNNLKFFKKKLNFFKKNLQKVKNIGIFFKKFDFSKLIALRRHFYLKKKYFNAINLFLINFLNFFLKKKFYLVLTKLNRLVKFVDSEKLLFYIFYVVKRKIKKFKTLKYTKIFYKVLYLSLRLKDSQFFLK